MSADDSPHLQGLVPYWRAAVQLQNGMNYYSLGLFGLTAKLKPDPAQSGTDRYTDCGFDSTYQRTGENGNGNGIQANLIYL